MGKIYFTLDKVLNELEVTPNYVAVKAQVRPNTLYKMQDNDIARINIDVLEKILDALNEISREKSIHTKFNIEDVLTYK
ncbi:helix-turn-helix domain-containing protein [Bacillus infantis]|uniref:Helix-turn-helix domain-containing protein n=1 Tax=Bacillus infantis TaxID=324767 RepID=A0A5D4RWU0_9BACI|nr:helix-turn-helix transcriptional regulator [Bacillus infantis]TYS55787.1 helix-turn-helix domain-containing protein [Bacillus infantis]